MHPETELAIVAAFAGFLLKTFLGFCICWALSKVIASPSRRFLVWFAFLALCGGTWFTVIVNLLPHAAEVPLSSARIASAQAVARWQMPVAWAFPLLEVERFLGGLYLLSLTYFLVIRIKKQLRLRWVLRFAYTAPAPVESLFRSVAIHARAAKIRLLVLSGIYSPATFGWIHPVVLLPPVCLEQDEAELADIFRHEVQHVVRRDFFFNNIAGFCKALLFFHPACWYAMRRMELEGELACDSAVVNDSPERRATYAECLVRFARLHAAQDPTPWNLDFAGSSLQLKVRVRSVLAETAQIPRWLLALRVAIGLLLLAAFLYVAPSLRVAVSFARRVAQPILSSANPSRAHLARRHRFPLQSQRKKRVEGESSTPQPTTVAAAGQPAADLSTTSAVPHASATLSSGAPVPALQHRGAPGSATAYKPAQASVILISNPSSVTAANSGSSKGRSIASAFMTGASEAVRFAGSHGKDIH